MSAVRFFDVLSVSGGHLRGPFAASNFRNKNPIYNIKRPQNHGYPLSITLKLHLFSADPIPLGYLVISRCIHKCKIDTDRQHEKAVRNFTLFLTSRQKSCLLLCFVQHRPYYQAIVRRNDGIDMGHGLIFVEEVHLN